MNQYIDDDGKQKYHMSFPMVWPDGTELTVYSSEDNRRMVIKHSSGSHIEFKNDGTLVVKAVKDLHIGTSVNSSTVGEGGGNSSATNIRCHSDLNLMVEGKLNIECREFNLNAEDTSKMHTSGDFIVNGNNIIEKAKEQISLEGTKSIYTSTGELRENVVTRTSEIGTPTGGNIGGQSTMKVNGHFVIENLDPKGGITIKSAGYTNILTGAERIDLTGNPAVLSPRFDPTPMGKATYTHIVSANPGPTPKGVPGSSYFQCGPGGLTEVITGPVSRTNNGPTNHLFNGPFSEQYNLNKNKTVLGNEIASITGIYRLSALFIFLN